MARTSDFSHLPTCMAHQLRGSLFDPFEEHMQRIDRACIYPPFQGENSGSSVY